MTCSEKNFVTSQCIYGIMIAKPDMDEDEQIEKAIRMAGKIIAANEPIKQSPECPVDDTNICH